MMTREQGLAERIKQLQRDLLALKSMQRIGSGNIAVYESDDTAGDSAGDSRYGYAMFTATTSDIQLVSGFELSVETLEGYYAMANTHATLAQRSTDYQVARLESSWVVAWFKGMIGFDAISVVGTIKTTTPNTVTAEVEVGTL